MTPPALPGEVWRARVPDVGAPGPKEGWWCAVASNVRHDGLIAYIYAPGEFGPAEWWAAYDHYAVDIMAAWAGHERARADAAEAERDAARGVAQLAAEERDAAGRIALAADIRSLRAGAAAWMQRRLVDAYRDERDRMRVERDALRKQLARAQDELDAYRDAHRGRATP